MKSTELLQEVQEVVGHELERINTDRVPLHSQHEAYAVIKEKYEGASENVHHIEGFVEEFWECVKDKNTACYADVLMTVRDCAIKCAVEVIRIAIAGQHAIDCLEETNKQGEKYERNQHENGE